MQLPSLSKRNPYDPLPGLVALLIMPPLVYLGLYGLLSVAGAPVGCAADGISPIPAVSSGGTIAIGERALQFSTASIIIGWALSFFIFALTLMCAAMNERMAVKFRESVEAMAVFCTITSMLIAVAGITSCL